MFHKLKEFINVGKDQINIFGSLTDTDCEFHFKKDDGEWLTYIPSGIYGGEYDFLLDYYVVSILPKVRLNNPRIFGNFSISPYLVINLVKDVDSQEIGII